MRSLQVTSLVFVTLAIVGRVLAAPIDQSDSAVNGLGVQVARASDSTATPDMISGSHDYANDEIYRLYSCKLNRIKRLAFDQKKHQEALDETEPLLGQLTGILQAQKEESSPLRSNVAFNLSYVHYVRAVCMDALGKPIDAFVEAYKLKRTCAMSTTCPAQETKDFIGWLMERNSSLEPLALLGLRADTPDMNDVKRAHRRYLLMLHPDKNQSDEEELKSFKSELYEKVQDAYNTIQSDETLKNDTDE